MRHLLNRMFLLLFIATLSAAHIESASGEEPIQMITIRIADDSSCLVEDESVPCAQVLAHLRDVLKVPVGTRLRILPDKASTYEATTKLIEQLQKSELKLKVGHVNAAENQKE